MPDFLDFLDPVAREAFRGRALARQQANDPGQDPVGLAPDEESSWLGRRLDESLGGIAYLGKMLDKYTGARALRGVLGGKPEELLSVLPGSDSLGLTKEENVVQGTDLLARSGLITPGDQSWENQLAGFGVEAVLDPSTYVGIGPLTRAGKAAAAGGTKLAPRLSERIAAGQSGLLSVGLPFMDKAVVGTGDTAAAIARNFWKPVTVPGEAAALGAEKYLGGPAERLLGFNPVSAIGDLGDAAYRQGRAVFDTRVAGTTSRAGQEIASGVTTPTYDRLASDAMKRFADTAVDVDPLLKKSPEAARAAQAAMTQIAETPADFGAKLVQYQKRLEATGMDPAVVATQMNDLAAITSQAEKYAKVSGADVKLAPFFDADEQALLGKHATAAADVLREMRAGEERLGIKAPSLFDILDYFPRQKGALPQQPNEGFWQYAKRATADFNARHEFQNKRLEPFHDIPGGTDQLNELIKDPRFSGPGASLWGPKDKESLRAQDELAKLLTGKGLVHQQPDGLIAKKVKELSNILRSMDPIYTKEGRDFFDLDFAGNLLRRGESNARTVATAEGAYAGIAKFAKPADQFKAGDGARVTDVLEALGLTAAPGGVPRSWEIVKAKLGLADLDAVKDLKLPNDLAQDLVRMGTAWRDPAELKPVLQAWDMMANLFKTGVTTIFPAFHSRNLASGLFNMYRGDALSKNLVEIRDASGLIRGNPLSAETAAKLYPGVAPDKASKLLLKELVAGRVSLGKQTRRVGEVAGAAGEDMSYRLPDFQHTEIPGTHWIETGIPGVSKTRIEVDDPKLAGTLKLGRGEEILGHGYDPKFRGQTFKERLGDIAGNLKPSGTDWSTIRREVLSPTGVAGVGAKDDVNVLVKTGRAVGNEIEDTLRTAHYIGRRIRGDSPAQAAQNVAKYHIDYSRSTPVEKGVLRRLYPWYSFCVPESYEILTRQGWKNHWQVAVGDEVLSLNHDTGEMEWDRLQAVNVFDHDGGLVVLENRGCKFLSTDEHRWPTCRRRKQVKGHWYGGTRDFTTSINLTGEHTIPRCGEFKGNRSVLSPRLAAILGWVVTDGSVRWRNGYCEMVVYQSAAKHVVKVEAALGMARRRSVDTRTSRTNGFASSAPVHCVSVRAVDVRAITCVFRTKADLQTVVGGLSREAAEAMFDAMMLAEGSMTATGQQHFHQSRKNAAVLDAFQMLCYLTGRSANLASEGAYVMRNKMMDVGGSMGKREHYTGKVWCPTTKNGTWVMRSEGKAIITGNSAGNLPPLLEDLATQPGKLATATRLVSGVRDPSQFVPAFIGEGASIPVPGAPDGQQRYISSFGLPIEDELLKTIGSAARGDVSRTFQQAIGMANPVVKLPFEQAFGRQLFSGRRLDELKPSPTVGLGGLLPDDVTRGLTEVVANSPAARAVNTVDRLLDPRKSLGATLVNLGTGVRLSDVETARQEAIAARELVKDKLRGSSETKVREEVYVPADLRGQLDPNERFLLELLKSTNQRVVDQQKEEKLRTGR